MSQPCVTVVIPVYNAARFVDECVCSVLDQSLRDIEVILVDDGSTDGSWTRLVELGARDRRVVLLRHPGNENRGVSRTRALAVEHAAGKHVAFLDADDLCAPDRLERQKYELARHPECVLCHTGVSIFGDPALVEAFKVYADQFGMPCNEQMVYAYADRKDALARNPVCNSSVMARTDALRKAPLGLPQLFQYEDWFLWLMLAEKGKFLYLPECLARYRVHAGSASERVRASRLRQYYSQAELLLAVLGQAESHHLHGRALDALQDVLTSLIKLYRRQAGLEMQGGGGELVPTLRHAHRRSKRWDKLRSTLRRWVTGFEP